MEISALTDWNDLLNNQFIFLSIPTPVPVLLLLYQKPKPHEKKTSVMEQTITLSKKPD